MIGVFEENPKKLNCKKSRGADPKLKAWDYGGPWVVNVTNGAMQHEAEVHSKELGHLVRQ